MEFIQDIDLLRDVINEMVIADDIHLFEGEILELSQVLDNLIYLYYNSQGNTELQ
jgi:hypothetical protein